MITNRITRKNNNMIKQVSLSVLAVAMLASCETKQTADVVEPTPVRVQKLDKTTITKELNYKANLEADEQVFYAPAQACRIGKIYVEVGDHIKKGDLLVEMDPTNLYQAQVRFKNVETEYQRALKLKETGSISQQSYDAAVANYEVSKSTMQNLLENTKLVAPFNGVVTGKYFENGELYTGAAAGGASKPSIISIEKINPLKAYVAIPESYFTSIKKGCAIELESEVYPGRKFAGSVSIVYPTIDSNSRTFNVEIKVPNSDEALRPGMYGSINFILGQTDAIVVSSMAVLKLQGSNDRYIFVNRDGVAKRIGVKLGKRFDDKIEIFSNEIKTGDEIVVVGQGKLIDGTVLNVVKD